MAQVSQAPAASPSDAAAPPKEWRTARLAVLAVFFTNGALFANWVARIPQIQAQHSLNEGGLGIVLLGISVGVISALVLVGGLIARFGSRRITWVMGLVYCALLPPLALMPHPIALWVGLFFFGGVMSSMDVAMNAQAVDVEGRSKRKLMSSFHAAWSIGGVTGAIMGAIAVSLDATLLAHFVVASLVMMTIIITARPYLLIDDPAVHADDSGATFRLPSRALLPLGAVALFSAIGEGAMADWSAVYMTSIIQSDASAAALAYGAFALMMTAGRLSGDYLASRLRNDWLVRGSGVVALTGMILLIAAPNTIVALIGFGIVGAGLSITIPLTFSAAGNMPGIPAGTGIAGVATIGYAGFLAGPPVIGLLAQALSLQVAFVLVALMVATLIITGGALRAAQTDAPTGDAPTGDAPTGDAP